ncbi:PilZ domain-containing protein [Roseibium hamelinense]|uniref:PilZ domain-containing protein n=1 Tax=Roseibium hamelinense TaxID=150831 RepID=A0A562TJE6_9HYPH|nr:PilZ domain-containing protein [Roseibium hamelinense]MTI42789.1 PilZ domain-containing protein [Roseibium hamelinense]TWI93438.1 PilZ domain-containing protein [Roseibium hamelinense]
MQDADAQNPLHTDEEADTQLPRQHRARVLKKAKVLFKDGLRSVPCVVRNISEGGAQIHFEQPYLIPTQFELRIELEGFEVTCERRWEDGLVCGVQFVSEKRHIATERKQVLQTSEQALPTRAVAADVDDLAAKTSTAGENRAIPASISPVRHARQRGFGKRR